MILLRDFVGKRMIILQRQGLISFAMSSSGEERFFDSPLSEQGIVGFEIGI